MRILNFVTLVAVLATTVLAMADPSSAVVLRYRQSGPWQDVSDGTTPGWYPNGTSNPGTNVPIAGDEARVNWAGNTVTLDYAAPLFEKIRIGVDESGIVEINSGGVLTTNQDVIVGSNGFIEGTLDVNDGAVVNVGRIIWVATGPVVGDTLGYLNINSGGVVNVVSHLWWGNTGTAEINISGTLKQTGGILGLGTSNAVSPGGGTAIVNVLDGGLFALYNIHGGGTQSSIQPGSYIDISGSGQLTLPGDFVGVLEGYRDANKLYGNGVPGAVDITLSPIVGGPGDFNEDGLVDGADFLEWQRDVNVGILADWQANYGTSGMQTVVTASMPLLTAVAAVPEPGALTLLLVSCFAMSGLRRSHCR